MIPISHDPLRQQRLLDQREEREHLNPSRNQSRIQSLISRLPSFSTGRSRHRSFDDTQVQSRSHREISLPPEILNRSRSSSEGVVLEFSPSDKCSYEEFVLDLGKNPESTRLIIPEHLRSSITDDNINACLKLIPHVEELDLSDCIQLTGSFLESIAIYSSLHSINLSCTNKLQGDNLKFLGNCVQLRELNFLGNTAIRDKDFSFLKGTPNLTSLAGP